MQAVSLPMIALYLALAGIAACGGDNLALCDDCEAPTATPSVTPSATAASPSTTPT